MYDETRMVSVKKDNKKIQYNLSIIYKKHTKNITDITILLKSRYINFV